MTEKLPDMSASIEAAAAPQKETEDHDSHGQEQLPEALARPSAEELEVARELVRSARERGTALVLRWPLAVTHVAAGCNVTITKCGTCQQRAI